MARKIEMTIEEKERLGWDIANIEAGIARRNPAAADLPELRARLAANKKTLTKCVIVADDPDEYDRNDPEHTN